MSRTILALQKKLPAARHLQKVRFKLKIERNGVELRLRHFYEGVESTQESLHKRV